MAGYNPTGRSVGWRRRGSASSSFKVEVQGLSELEAALNDLPKAVGRGVMRRTLLKAAQPVADHARKIARVVTGRLRDSIIVSTRAKKTAGGAAFATVLQEGGSRSQARLALRQANRTAAAEKSEVEVYVGSTTPYAHLVEFGTSRSRSFPFLRPAWDAERQGVLDQIKGLLWQEIDRAVKRLAKKAAKGG